MRRPFLCIFLVFLTALQAACYKPPPPRDVRNAEKVEPRTLFIALDGVDHEVMQELYDEGYFREFLRPIPLISTFPSDTTVGFTGIFQPIDVGRVPGYESRFYSYKDNRIIGGTIGDIHKIHVPYKDYFHSYRHQIPQKAVMYVFPGMAGKQDLVNTEEILFNSDKKFLMTYLGGTDGAAHLLGRGRIKTFLKFMDGFLKRMQKRYRERRGGELRVVLFSDHGFHHRAPKMISVGDVARKLDQRGFRLGKSVKSERDAVVVPFGLLSAGVLFTPLKHRGEITRAIAEIDGVDLVFWHDNDKKRIHVRDALGATAFFEYHGARKYRYVAEDGDPLGYEKLLREKGLKPGKWLKDSEWREIAARHDYPDAGYRLHDAFFNLVENPANVMFSTKPGWQFGSAIARVGTWLKFGHKGTHGGLFKATTYGVAMTNLPGASAWPEFLRYDELFPYFLPAVTSSYRKDAGGAKRELSVVLTPEQSLH